MTRNSISRYILRSAGEVKRFRIMMRVIPIVIAVLVALSSVVYVSSVMYNRYGSYTVTVNKFDNLNYSIALTEYMIEDPDNEGKLIPGKPVARLNSKASEQIRDMDGATLPDDIDQISGVHNGENYIAYTYYLVNNGEKTLTYEYNLYIVNTTNGVEKGVRVRLYEDGVATTFARTRTDGTGPEEGTVAFMGDTTIVRKQVSNFGPGAYTRFTVVIWIEGNDDDTTDDIIGGQFKVDMKVNIIGDAEGTPIDFEQQS
ncbi:MAG: hypothetical protein J6Z13_04920 [Clostridia bacterium]|nr:hypothetical protein [Clostridia bacterium]